MPKTCPKQPYVALSPTTACPTDPRQYYAIGSSLPMAPLYYGDGVTCTATTGAATENYYGVGQPLALAALSRTPDTAPSHRIQLIHYTTPDGLAFRADEVYDDQEDADCYPDGAARWHDSLRGLRCATCGRITANNTCTTAIDLVEVDTGAAGCAPPTVPKFATKYHPTADRHVHVHDRGPHRSARCTAEPSTTRASTCTAYAPADTKLYNVGAVVPLTDFVTAAVVNDP